MKPILRDLPVPIESTRLLIRPPMPGDGPALNAAVLETFDHLKEWMPWAQERPSVEDNEEWVRHAYARWITREDLPLTLWCRQSGEFVGGSGFHRVDWNLPKFEIGFWLRKRHQGRGLATECTAALTRYAFEVLGARRLEIRCDAKNDRSRLIAERLGFRQEACLKGDSLRPGGRELRDTLIFARDAVTGLPAF